MREKKTSWPFRLIVLFIFTLFLGLIFDAFSGFHFVQESNSVLGAIGILIVLGILYLVGDCIVTGVASIDKAEHPLWRRAFNLFVLLVTTGLLAIMVYYALTIIQIL